MSILLLILGLVLFVLLVVVHEYGHFIMARRHDVAVEEFGIGFPPRAKLLAKKKGTLYTLNWLPLGGFVRLKGERDTATEPHSYGAAKLSTKVKILLAGVTMNLLAALALFTLVALIGMPKLLPNQFTVSSDTKIVKDVQNKGVVKIDEVEKGSPAANIKLKIDDQIVSVAGVTIDSPDKLSATTKANAGKTVAVVTKHNGAAITKTVQLNKTSPYLGVGQYSGEVGFQIRRSTWSAPVVAVGVTRDFTVATLKGLGSAIKGLGSTIAGLATGNTAARQSGQTEASSQVSGPIGIVVVIYDLAKLGLAPVLFVVAIISLTLAIMNVLPIPALDGGKLFLTLLFHLINKPLTEKVENRAYGTGFAVLMLLVVLTSIVDVKRFL